MAIRVIIDALYEDDTPTEVRLYRRPRGDRLLSIKNLRKFASEGDTVGLRSEATVNADMSFEIRVLVYKVDETEPPPTEKPMPPDDPCDDCTHWIGNIPRSKHE